jgi:hypothetical protein
MHRAVGGIHIHSRFSDGSGTVAEIAAAGEAAGVDFLILTDHATLKARQKGLEGRHGKVLVIVGEETGWRKGHVLSIGASQRIRAHSTDPRDIVPAIHRAGGLSFITHPDGRPKPEFRISDARWKVKAALGMTGLEVWSYMYDWIEQTHWWNLPHRIFKPTTALNGPSSETLATWDRLGLEQTVVGYGGVDAHAKKVFPGIKIFPYESMFSALKNYLLLEQPLSGQPVEDKKNILDALRKGRLYFALNRQGENPDFLFEGIQGTKTFPMGSIIDFGNGPVRLQGRTPAGGWTRVLWNGATVFETNRMNWELVPQVSGVWRVEVYKSHTQPWVFSNPLYLRG